METHNRQFVDCVVHFHSMFAYLGRYHNSLTINVEHIGAANKIQWPVTTHKVNEIATLTHHEQQNLQLSNRDVNSVGAWTCNHSNHPHFRASDKANADANAMTATQQTKSRITIRKSILKTHIDNTTIPDGPKGCQGRNLAFAHVHIPRNTRNCGISIPF